MVFLFIVAAGGALGFVLSLLPPPPHGWSESQRLAARYIGLAVAVIFGLISWYVGVRGESRLREEWHHIVLTVPVGQTLGAGAVMLAASALLFGWEREFEAGRARVSLAFGPLVALLLLAIGSFAVILSLLVAVGRAVGGTRRH